MPDRADTIKCLEILMHRCAFHHWMEEVEVIGEAIAILNEQARCWEELRKCVMEMCDNGGTGNQHDVCAYIVHLMDVIEGKVKK